LNSVEKDKEGGAKAPFILSKKKGGRVPSIPDDKGEKKKRGGCPLTPKRPGEEREKKLSSD